MWMVQPLHKQAIYVILLRELKRYWRAKARMVMLIAQGFFFLLVFGLGLGHFIGRFGNAPNYLSFVTPGVIGMVLLSSSVFSGVQVIFDRHFGFLKEMLIAPVSRTSIVLGKILGSAVTASFHGITIMSVAAAFGAFQPSFALAMGIPAAIGVMLLIAAGFVAVGVVIGSILNDFHSFQLMSTFIMWPLFTLSGLFFPIDASPFAVQVAMLCNPLFYGVELLRWFLLGTITPILGPYGCLISIGVLSVFIVLMAAIASRLFSRVQV
jgi:ABC-2 type transport system permease protein